jgi:fructokinase
MSIVVIGAVLWDIYDDTRRIGGAPFNFAAHAARLGCEVRFVSAVGVDELGDETQERMRDLGLSRRYVRQTPEAPTGTVRVSLRAGQPTYAIGRPAAYDLADLSDEELDALAAERPAILYYGTLEQMSPTVRNTTRRLMARLPSAERLYDVNLRLNSYTPELVRELVGSATVLKMNEDEAAEVAGMLGETARLPQAVCQALAARQRMRCVCVTRGAEGCVLWVDGEYAEAPGLPVAATDTVGAGDAFAAGLAFGLGRAWPARRVAEFANRLGALVASRAGAIPDWAPEELGSPGP